MKTCLQCAFLAMFRGHHWCTKINGPVFTLGRAETCEHYKRDEVIGEEVIEE